MGIQGLYKPKKSWGGCHHLFLVYEASKLSTVYVVKSAVLGLQRAFENSVFSPSVQSSLDKVGMSDNFETTRLPNFKNFQSYFYLFLKFLLTSCLFERLPFSQCSCSKKSMTSNDVNQNPSSVTTLIDTRAMTQFDELFKGAIISLLQGTDHRLNELLQPKNMEASRSMH